MSSKCLACWDTNSIQQSQSITEETAEGHVSLLQIHLCKRERKVGGSGEWGYNIYFLLISCWRGQVLKAVHLVGWMWGRSPEVSPAEPPGCWGWCYRLALESPKTEHTSTHTLQPSVSPPGRKKGVIHPVQKYISKPDIKEFDAKVLETEA